MRFDGNKLKALREARRFDQTTLAAHARKYLSGMNQSQISRYENSGQQPSARSAVALARALDVPVEEFYEGEDNAARERREASGADDEESRPLSRDEFQLLGDLMARLGSTITRSAA